METLKCTVSGSLHRFLPDIRQVILQLRMEDVVILSPKSTEAVGAQADFVMLKGDSGHPSGIERNHLRCIGVSDFLYVVNPEGYVGPSATLEIGYALARSVPVYCATQPSEEIIASLVQVEPDIPVLARRVREIAPVIPPRNALLPALQQYVSDMVRERGFSDESLRDAVLLLVEEVGELATAVRTDTGLKVSQEEGTRRKPIQDELADCLVYILHIANLAIVDLETAFLEKEALNATRKWSVARER